MDTTLVLLGFALPGLIGLVTGLGAAALKRAGSRGLPPGESFLDEGFIGARVLAVLGITSGLFVSMFGIGGPPNLSFTAMEGNLPLIAPVIGAIGLAGVLITAARGSRAPGGERGFGWRASWIGALIAGAAGSLIALGKPLWSGTLAHSGIVWVPIVFGVWGALSAASIGGIVRSGARVSAAIVLAGIALALGVDLLCTAGQEMGEYGLGAAVVCVGWVAGFLILRGSPGPGAILAMCSALAALLACAVIRSNTPWWQCAVLGLAAPAAWVVDRAIARRLRSFPGACLRIGVAAIIALIAVLPDAIKLAGMASRGEL
jgi:hypothetical protein